MEEQVDLEMTLQISEVFSVMGKCMHHLVHGSILNCPVLMGKKQLQLHFLARTNTFFCSSGFHILLNEFGTRRTTVSSGQRAHSQFSHS